MKDLETIIGQLGRDEMHDLLFDAVETIVEATIREVTRAPKDSRKANLMGFLYRNREALQDLGVDLDD